MTVIHLRLIVANASRRASLQDAFRADPEFRIVSEKADFAPGPVPDVLVLDLADPDVLQPRFWITTQLLYPAARFMAIAEAPIGETALQLALQAGTYVVGWPVAGERLGTVARDAFYGHGYVPQGAVFEAMATLLERLNQNASSIHIGGLHLDLRKYQASLERRPLGLSPREFKVLVYLAQHAGRLIPYTELLKAGWDDPPPVTSAYDKVQTCLRRLQRKLGAESQGIPYIETVRGLGCRMTTDAEQQARARRAVQNASDPLRTSYVNLPVASDEIVTRLTPN